MARIRTVKPEFWTDSKIVALTPLARLVYIGMWNFADDSGVIEDDPLEIKLRVAPTDDIDMATVIAELVSSGRVKRAVAPDGTHVLVIPRFTEHQRINRPSNPRHGDPDKFNYPPPPPPGSPSTHAPLTEPHMHARARDPEGKGRDKPPLPPHEPSVNPPVENPGGTAAPKPQAVLDRIISQTPPKVATRLKAGLNGHHRTAAQTALANGWTPPALAHAVAGRWDNVHDPPKALLARLRSVGAPPASNTPPPFDPATDVAPLEEASDPTTTRAQLDAIRNQHIRGPNP